MRALVFTMIVLGVLSSMLASPLAPPAGPVSSTGRIGPRIELNQENTSGNASSTFVISQPGSYYLARSNIISENPWANIDNEPSGD